MNEDKNIHIPNTENEPMTTPAHHSYEPESVTNGPILVLLVALLLAVLGGMFYWFTMLDNDGPILSPTVLRPTAEQNREPESTGARAQAEAMGIVSTSDEIPAIEADVESTNLDSLDAELDAIEAELDAAMIEESGTTPPAP